METAVYFDVRVWNAEFPVNIHSVAAFTVRPQRDWDISLFVPENPWLPTTCEPYTLERAIEWYAKRGRTVTVYVIDQRTHQTLRRYEWKFVPPTEAN